MEINMIKKLLEKNNLNQSAYGMDFIEDCKRVGKIIKRVNDLKRKKQSLKEYYEKKLLEIEDEENKIGCQHEIKTHYCDPSGGSDSFDQCDICGKEIR